MLSSLKKKFFREEGFFYGKIYAGKNVFAGLKIE